MNKKIKKYRITWWHTPTFKRGGFRSIDPIPNKEESNNGDSKDKDSSN